MGSGIAQIAAQAGRFVVLVDADHEALTRSEAQLAKVFRRLVEKGRFTQETAQEIEARITRTTDLQALAQCDAVVEAIVEDLDAKTALL